MHGPSVTETTNSSRRKRTQGPFNHRRTRQFRYRGSVPRTYLVISSSRRGDDADNDRQVGREIRGSRGSKRKNVIVVVVVVVISPPKSVKNCSFSDERSTLNSGAHRGAEGERGRDYRVSRPSFDLIAIPVRRRRDRYLGNWY